MKQLILYAFIVVVLVQCKDPYEVKVKNTDQSVLVVDGFLNSNGPTTIHLSRSVALNNKTIKAEPGATVTVEGKDNSSYNLQPLSPGEYTHSGLPLANGQPYRLHIKTADGKEYASDYVTVKNNPAIDSINWKRNAEEVTIYANTHDPASNTKYYRWEFEETWEIHSTYFADIKYDYLTGKIVPRLPNELVFICWKYNNSTSIFLGSTAKLQQDVVFEQPLVHIPNRSEKLGVRYSVLVKQYALTREAYDYFEQMKKNTESLGSIFDAQPSDLSGNIHNLQDNQERVIGFITATALQQKRIFINSTDVPNWNFILVCSNYEVPNKPDSLKYYIPNIYLPYFTVFEGFTIKSYLTGYPQCVDCTLRGGSTPRPSYW